VLDVGIEAKNHGVARISVVENCVGRNDYGSTDGQCGTHRWGFPEGKCRRHDM
jgi:hypothetical protein